MDTRTNDRSWGERPPPRNPPGPFGPPLTEGPWVEAYAAAVRVQAKLLREEYPMSVAGAIKDMNARHDKLPQPFSIEGGTD